MWVDGGVVLFVLSWMLDVWCDVVRVRRSLCRGVQGVRCEAVLFQKVRSSEERCARLRLGRTLAGRGGPSREGGTVRWAAW